MWNAVPSLTWILVSAADIDDVKYVVDTSEVIPVRVTLLSLSCIPWFEWNTLILLCELVYVGDVPTYASLTAPPSTTSPL